MKLESTYPRDMVWEPWVTGSTKGMALEFLYRLAAYARAHNLPMDVFGYRSLEDQRRLYELYKSGARDVAAAAPGLSWHNYGFAADLNTAWKDYAVKNWVNTSWRRQDLLGYGLYLPMNTVDRPNGPIEWWHVQPIETFGVPATIKARAAFRDPAERMAA
jgi:hypothetical protein